MDAPPASPLAPEEIHAVLSHLACEFAHPINALRGALTRIDTPQIGPADPAFAMEDVCEDLLTLTDRYLDYMWIAHGGEAPRSAPTTLHAMVQVAESRFLARAPARRVVATLNGPDAEVLTDPTVFSAVCDLLADNVAQYTPPEAIVRVEITRLADSWSLTVADEGPGIPPEDLGRVLDPFVRLNRDVKAGIRGAGLGLSVCRALVHMLGGTITITSPPAGGTEVRVDLAESPPLATDREISRSTRLRTAQVAARLSDVPNLSA